MAGLLKTITTEDDANKVYDPVRIIAVALAILFIVLTAWSVIVQGHEFKYLEFGGGAGGLLTAVGGALYMKAKADEPPKGQPGGPAA